MKGKPIATVVGLVAIVGCCIGIPLLIASSFAAGLFAWLTDNALLGLLLVIAAGAAYFYTRDRNKRRAAPAGDEGTTRSSTDDPVGRPQRLQGTMGDDRDR